MQDSRSVTRPLQAGVSSDDYPWAREREAVEALERLDMERCRVCLDRVAREIRVTSGTSLAAAAILLSDLLKLFERRLHPSPSPEASRSERLQRARRLGSSVDLDGLTQAFRAEVEQILAPLRATASLSPAVVRARTFLDRNYGRRVTLREVARAVHLSPNYLSTLFRRETGMTVTDYLRKRRMRLAERLLVDGRHTISEIAYQVGYRNYRDFHRNFVRARGSSPRTFQRLCRAAVPPTLDPI